MSFWCGSLIFFPYFYWLVAFGSDHSQGAPVELDVEDGCFAWERARLDRWLQLLEALAALPVIKLERTVVTAAYQDIVFINCEWVYHNIVIRNRSKLVTFWLFPYADFVWASRCKGVLLVVVSQRPHAFLVLGQGLQGRASANIPHTNHLIVGCCDDLGLVWLANDVFNCICMPSKNVNLGFGAHIPDSGCRISAASNQEVKFWVQSQRICTAQMAMIVSDDFILLQIPAFDHLILAAGEEIWMSIWNCQSSHGVDMSSQRDFQLAVDQIPKLDGPVIWPSCKEFVHGIYSDASYPSCVAAYNSLQLPRRVPLHFYLLSLS